MRILWLSPYPFEPSVHGGRIRLGNLVRHAAMLGHQVELWILHADDAETGVAERVLPPAVSLWRAEGRSRRSVIEKCAAVLSRLPEEAWVSWNPEVAAALAALPPHRFDVAVLEQAHMGAYAPLLSARGVPWILDAQNIEWRLTKQLARRAGSLKTWLRLWADAAKYRRFERRLFADAAVVSAMSEDDAYRITEDCATAKVEVHRNGVDLEYFSWLDHGSTTGARLVMTGTLGYPPNLDAAMWMHDEVLPAIRSRVPDATVALVGHSGPEHLFRLHDPKRGFNIVGAVPDVRPYLRDADLFVMPLRSGSGTRLKAGEALASGLPVVSTRLGVEGMGMVERNLVLTAESPDEFAAAVARGLTDTALRRHLSLAGREYAEEALDWNRLATAFAMMLEEVAHG